MADLNLGHLISKFVNYKPVNIQKQASNNAQVQQFQQSTTQDIQKNSDVTQYSTPQAKSMAGSDQSAYVKDMMGLPRNMNELIYIVQQKMTMNQFNQKFANMQRNAMSQTQAQILAQLQGLSLTSAQNILLNGNKMALNQLQNNLKNLTISQNALINLTEISSMIQSNGKDAITKLITTMTNSAKLGITDLSQLKETAKLINASIATAAKNDAAQTMKLLMLLYLPWLPLQEGVGFDLDIEQDKNKETSDSILVITITTLNYGNVIATLALESSNSVHVNIECVKEFPKAELESRIKGDEKHYSMDSELSFTQSSQTTVNEAQEKPQAKINMSNTNEINPFLLLMSHTIIRHVIEIDKNTSNGVTSHID